ncbi:hypothetical protein LZC95_37980 [Pendulispora brunnea]|uniref:Secreted protein n=1 Tax=Pendulispora brunnea TaxID=2905690 RepID=A0ABZ2K0G3_9BACT
MKRLSKIHALTILTALSGAVASTAFAAESQDENTDDAVLADRRVPECSDDASAANPCWEAGLGNRWVKFKNTGNTQVKVVAVFRRNHRQGELERTSGRHEGNVAILKPGQDAVWHFLATDGPEDYVVRDIR